MTSDLITRLSKLDAPDREVDAEIHALFHETIWKFEDGRKVFRDIPSYTASVDAAIALAERVLPSDFIDIEVNQRRHMGVLSGRAEICAPNFEAEVRAATPAIALLIALLRAKEASNAD